MNIRELVQLVDEAAAANNTVVDKSGTGTFPGDANKKTNAPASNPQSNFNVSYQGQKVDNKPANLMPKAAAANQQGATNIQYPTINIPPKASNQSTAGQAGTAGTAPSAGGTMDPRLQQPVDAEPEQPKKTFAQKLGTVAANVGAIPGAFKGIKTAYQKGKADMAARVGGPVNQPAAGGGAAPQGQAGGAGGGSQAEIDDLRQMINRLDAKLVKHGITQ